MEKKWKLPSAEAIKAKTGSDPSSFTIEISDNAGWGFVYEVPYEALGEILPAFEGRECDYGDYRGTFSKRRRWRKRKKRVLTESNFLSLYLDDIPPKKKED